MTPITATAGARVLAPVASRRVTPRSTPTARVLAHRGLSGATRPDNTVAAVAAALQLGAHGVEVDVRLTVDGELVCSHDPVLVGRDGREVVIADATAAQVRSLDLGAGHRPATLAEVLAVVALHDRSVVVEAKSVDAPGYARRLGRELAGALSGRPARVTVSSFDGDLLAALRPVLAPGLARTALLGRGETPLTTLLRRAVDEGHDEVHPAVATVLEAPSAVGSAHRLGVGVTPWTVNGRHELRHLAALGVDAVITDHPARALDALAGHDPRPTPAVPRAC